MPFCEYFLRFLYKDENQFETLNEFSEHCNKFRPNKNNRFLSMSAILMSFRRSGIVFCLLKFCE